MSAAERRSTLNRIAEYIENDEWLSQSYAVYPAAIRAGEPASNEIVIGAALLNALGVLSAVGAALNLLSLMGWVRRGRRMRDSRVCIVCRYPREGIDGERCPECGVVYVTPPARG